MYPAVAARVARLRLLVERQLLLDSPGARKVQLLHEGARAAQHADAGLQHLLQSWTRVGQPLQIHAVPQRLIQPATVKARLRSWTFYWDGPVSH